MPKMTAMEAAVHVLRSEGVEVVFGVPGAAILPFYEALKGSRINHYWCGTRRAARMPPRATPGPRPARSASTSAPRDLPAPT